MYNRLVSVIVPVYNSEAVLERCIDSIRHQSYSTLEILLVDDGSTDSTGALCDRLASEDERIAVIHKANGGIASAQNAGLDAAKGDFIAFCDNDDIMAKRNIELLLGAIERSGADMAKGRWEQVSPDIYPEDLKILASQGTQPHRLVTFSHALTAYETVFTRLRRLLLGHKTRARYMTEANWGKLYRARLWSGVRFPERRYAQDIAVMGTLCSRSKKVVDIDAILYFWVQNAESVSHVKNFEFCHDCLVSSSEVFDMALTKAIAPRRSYFMMRRMLTLESAAVRSVEDREQQDRDWELFQAERRKLGVAQRLSCAVVSYIRRMESFVYDAVEAMR